MRWSLSEKAFTITAFTEQSILRSEEIIAKEIPVEGKFPKQLCS